MTEQRALPRINGRVDWDALATIFMGRHVDTFVRLGGGKATYDAIRADLTAWLDSLDLETRAAYPPDEPVVAVLGNLDLAWQEADMAEGWHVTAVVVDGDGLWTAYALSADGTQRTRGTDPTPAGALRKLTAAFPDMGSEPPAEPPASEVLPIADLAVAESAQVAPEHEATPDGARDWPSVLKWWQDLAWTQGVRAERAEEAVARLRKAAEQAIRDVEEAPFAHEKLTAAQVGLLAAIHTAPIEAEARAAAERDVAALLSIEAAAREWAAASEDLLNKALPLMGNPSRNARMAAAHKALRQALANPAAEPRWPSGPDDSNK